MRLPKPLTINKRISTNQNLKKITCFIDETEVSLKECGFEIDEEHEAPKIDFWKDECDKHPTSSHCKVYNE